MNVPFHKAMTVLLLAAVLLLPGCGVLIGSGTAGAILLWGTLEDPGDETVNQVPAVPTGTIETTGDRRGSIEISYFLQDGEGDPVNVMVEYSTDSGGAWTAATDAGGASDGMANLTASALGVPHTFVWDLQTDLPSASNWNQDINIRIIPADTVTTLAGQEWTSAGFTVNINTVPLATAITPSGSFPIKVPLQYILIDSESDAADIVVEYSLTGAAPWSTATRLSSEGEGLTNLAASPAGEVHSFVWDSLTDLPASVNLSGVYLRVTPQDSAAPSFVGPVWISDPFDNVNYNSAPSILGTTLSPVAVPATTMAISYTLIDNESDPVDITVEYQKDGSGPWLPATEASSGSDGTNDLSASPLPGDPHTFVWDFSAEPASDQTVVIRISIADGTFGNGIFTVPPTPWTSNSFQINATVGLHTSIVTLKDPPSPANDAVILTYTLLDDFSGTGHAINVRIQYSTDGGSTWLPAAGSLTEASWDATSEGTASLMADPDGEDHVFVWDSFKDLGGQDYPKPPTGQGVMIRVSSLEYGNFDDSPALSLMNTWVASVSGGGAGSLVGPACTVMDGAGNVYIADTVNSKIRVLNTQTTDQSFCGVSVPPNTMSVIGGTGISAYTGDNVLATMSALNFPRGLAVDSASPPNVYIADTLNHRIRRIDGTTGFITTVAGTGSPGFASQGKIATLAQVNAPQDLCFDANGNLWIADTANHCIRFLNLGSTPVNVFTQSYDPGMLPIISGQTDGEAGFDGEDKDFDSTGRKYDAPAGIVVDSAGNVYVSDANNHRIRAANGGNSSIVIAGVFLNPRRQKTIAGTGTKGFGGDTNDANTANIWRPHKLVLDSSANLFFADTNNHRIRAVNTGGAPLTVGAVTILANKIDTVAGGGLSIGDAIPALSARLVGPQGIALDGLSPQNLYIADAGTGRIRIVNSHPTNSLAGVATDQGSTISVAGGAIDTVAGEAPTGILFQDPRGVASDGTDFYIADPSRHQILKLTVATRILSVVAGTGTAGSSGDGGAATSAQLNTPFGLAFDSSGTLLLIADTANDSIRAVNLGSTGLSAYGQTIGAGNIETLSSSFSRPEGIVVDVNGYAGTVNDAFIANTGGHTIGQLSRSSGSVTTVAGDGTAGYVDDVYGDARFHSPSGVAIDSAGRIYVADTNNHRIRYFPLLGSVGTYGGSGSWGFNGDHQTLLNTNLQSPESILFDGSGNLIVFDTGNHCVRRASLGVFSIICGTGSAGFNGDHKPGQNTQLNQPFLGAFDGSGNFYFSDAGSRRLRRFHP